MYARREEYSFSATATDQRRDLDRVVFLSETAVVFVDLPLAAVLVVDFALVVVFLAAGFLAVGFLAGFVGADESRARFAPALADFGPSTRSRHHAIISSQM